MRLGRGRPSRPLITRAIVTLATVTGTVGATLANATSSASGAHGVSGTSSQTLANATSTATGAFGSGVSGTVAATLANATSTASGSSTTGTVAQTLANATSAATGAHGEAGTVARTLANFTSTASGSSTTGTSARTLANFTSTAVGTFGTGALYPASVDATHRKLLDQNGNVIMLHTFSSWGMAGNLSNANITVALEAIQAIGFNAVTVIPCQSMNYGGAGAAQWHPYQNLAGNSFFTGSAFASSFGSAWSSTDWVMTEATRLGMFVLMSLYSGSGNGQGGAEIISAGTTNMYNYGVSLATRYAGYANIVWHFGADQDFNWGTNPASMIDAFFHGVRDTEGSTHRIVVAEPGQYPTTSYNQFNNQAYTYFNCDVNSVYQYFSDPLSYFNNVWAESGATSMPVWDCEPPYLQAPYYGDENSDQRARHYTTYIRGGCGINLSDETWWPFDKNPIFGSGTWTATPAKAMVVEMGYAIDLVDAYMLDTSWAPVSTLVTTGASTDVAQGASSTAAIAYIPSSRTLAVDTTIIAGTGNVRLRWFDPSNNAYTTIANSEAQQTGRSVTHPGSNSVGDTDWLLVVDAGSGATGTAAVTLANFTSSASGSEVVGTSARTLANATSSASGTHSISGTSAQTLANFTSSATGAFGSNPVGTVAVTLANFTSTASGSSVVGSSAQTLANATSTATGGQGVAGTVAVTLGNATSNASGSETIGTVARTLANFTSTASGSETIGTAAVTLANFTSSAVGTSGLIYTITGHLTTSRGDLERTTGRADSERTTQGVR